ncbi:MAG: PEP-CTERM sorting domain-containing protein [Candidatus Spyradenecus sp.]
MKRVLVVVLTLLGAMSLEAVSVSWTQLTSGKGDKAFALPNEFQATASQVVTYAILIPQGVPSGDAFLLGVSGVNNKGEAKENWSQAYLKATAEGALSFSYKNDAKTATSLELGGASLSADKASLVAFTVDRRGKTFTVYKDGVKLKTIGGFTSLFPVDMVMLAYGQNFGGGDIFELDYKVYAYAGAITAADATIAAVTVPEPTVWALVAMGVAGMALRRKRA